jgi:predicted ATPase
LNDQTLLDFQDGTAQLYRDNGSQGPAYPFDWFRSAVASLPERHDNTKLTYFRQQIAKWIIVHPIPDPAFILANGSGENPHPTLDVGNYVGWYRYLSQDGGFASKLANDLKEVLSDFESFNLEPIGKDDRSLVVRFRNDSKQRFSFNFTELSDGQRMLIVLYTLLNLPEHEDLQGVTLFIDEPDNFVALREIQPWVRALYDRCSADEMQAILISHHPETINYLLMPANEQIGYWFERGNLQPTRLKRIATQAEQEGVPVSEIMALGWLPHE